MARIVIANLNGRAIDAGDGSASLLQHLHSGFVDWMHACGAKGRCTTCKAIVVEGHDNLESLTPAEMRYVKLGALRDGERLTCQARLKGGDVIIRVPDEYKLPHITYSS